MSMFKTFFHFQNTKRGFTLLLAALVASIVLALGSSIFTIAKKQVTLSSLGRDSQFAFYAADTAAECALYYDVRFSSFATSSLSPAMQPIQCDGVVVTPTIQGVPTANSAVTFFRIQDSTVNPAKNGLFWQDEAGVRQVGNCADVTIYKNPTPPYTVIHADGYSTECNTISSSNRTLQRSIELQY
jgi:hypothetical protein